MSNARYSQDTRDFYEKLLEGKSLEEKIKSLEIAERQKYHYYCDCSDGWTTEQNEEYELQWNEIIEMQREYQRELEEEQEQTNVKSKSR